MTPAELSDAVAAAARAAAEALGRPLTPPAEIAVTRPKNPAHGDYATNVAMQCSRQAGVPPRELAELIAGHLAKSPGIASVEVAGPGFLNVRLAPQALGDIARQVVIAGKDYGRTATLSGQRLNLEFVSANPTGPVHIGAGRWAAVGDALARLLEFSGAAVAREYYFNDAGAQIDHFAESVYRAGRGEPAPPNGYGGAYIAEIAEEVARRHPGVLAEPLDAALPLVRREAVALMFAEIKQSLAGFGVHFDVFFNEESLHTGGGLQAAVARLREVGHVYAADGALWLRTTDFGDDKDRVLVRSDGTPTYFCADCAYYLNKRERGFDRCLYMLGADHHGYVARMKAMAAGFGDDPEETIEILIGQLVNLVRDGQPVRMSKRAGTMVTLDDLVEAVGVDAARYALARSSTDSMVDLDLGLLARQAAENPVFYVQYAHARIASLMRHAAEVGVTMGPPEEFAADLLGHEREQALLGELGEFPRVVATAAQLREAHRVARYLERLAGTYHRFYDACRVLPTADAEPGSLHRARLWLCEATREVLANGLELLGVSAPDRM